MNEVQLFIKNQKLELISKIKIIDASFELRFYIVDIYKTM